MRRQAGESDDPWAAPDPALALAERQLRWYARHRDRSRVAYQVSELLILLTAAATTLAAALRASPWMTASLAAGSLVLAGQRKVFDWHESWVSFGGSWADLRAAIHDYRLLPEERRDEEAKRRLLRKVDEVVSGDTGRWASRRRQLATGGE